MSETLQVVPRLLQGYVDSRRRPRIGEPVTLTSIEEDGSPGREIVLDPSFFSVREHPAVMHQVVTAQLAAARAGTHSTKTRAEVSGGGAKPYRQKGTGRARQGSIRAPHWVGGGIAHGPKPRNYAQRTPKKMLRLALASALSNRAACQRLVVLEPWSSQEPSTKKAAALLSSVGASGNVLFVAGSHGEMNLSFNNIANVFTVQGDQLTTFDVLRADWVIFSLDALPGRLELSGAQDTASLEDAASVEHTASVEDTATEGDTASLEDAAFIEDTATEENGADG